jgi:hypothetical protein
MSVVKGAKSVRQGAVVGAADVANGSKTVLTALKRYFRSTSNNGHRQTGTVGLFSAIHVLRVNYQDVQLAFGRGQSRMRLFRLCGFTSITAACRPY